jgi:hypothetical protein
MKTLLSCLFLFATTFCVAQGGTLQVNNNGSSVGVVSSVPPVINLLSGCSATLTSAFNITCYPTVVGKTLQKSETAADTSLLSVTPPSSAGYLSGVYYILCSDGNICCSRLEYDLEGLQR